MNFNIRGENVEVTPALKDYVEKKVGKLDRYFDTPPTSAVQVKLKVLKDQHRVEVTIPFPGLLLRAEDRGNDMYASIDMVVNKLERQVRKYKTRVNRKAREVGGMRDLFKVVNDANYVDEDELQIVRTKRFNLKPMDAEEAILQMNLLGHSFFVFSNAANNEVNIVYKRNDGKYGLIEPEA